MPSIPPRWRFRFDSEDVSLRDLSWAEAVGVFRGSATGELSAETEGECASLEFNDAHAAVLYRGRDEVVLRPYFPHRSAADQDLEPFFCRCCGIRVGDRDQYLARFVTREDGFRLFVALLGGHPLPTELPDPYSGRLLPGFELAAAESAAGRLLEWRRLPSGEPNHIEPPHPPEALAGPLSSGEASSPPR